MSPAERWLHTDDDVRLSASFTWSARAECVVVLAHPHPQFGGTKEDRVIVAIAEALAARGASTLRFDFRGAGGSEGRHERGRGELLDVRAAVRYAREQTALPVVLVGYSFGSWLIASALSDSAHAAVLGTIDRVVLVAPPVALLPFSPVFSRLPPMSIAVGEHDAFCSLGGARTLAARMSAHLSLVAGADHFFSRGLPELSRRVCGRVLRAAPVNETSSMNEGWSAE